MMLPQADSTAVAVYSEYSEAQTEQQPVKLTPRVVLSWLSKNATPEQQDSIIQAHFKPSAERHWSTRPDTLHLPGFPIDHSYTNVVAPEYDRDTYFFNHTFYTRGIVGDRMGVAGDPVPYTIAGDNVITSILLGCFCLALVACSQSRSFIIRQVKYFFRMPRLGMTEITETSNELRFQFFLVLQTCLLAAIGYFFYTLSYVADTFVIDPYAVIGIYGGLFVAYFLLKIFLYTVVGGVFFDGKKNRQWLKSFLFLFAAEGILFFPMVMLRAYFNLSIENAVSYTFFVIGIVKILSFYKSYLIFFKGNGGLLQIILYFCALEIVPLLSCWGVLTLISEQLKINF